MEMSVYIVHPDEGVIPPALISRSISTGAANRSLLNPGIRVVYCSILLYKSSIQEDWLIYPTAQKQILQENIHFSITGLRHRVHQI